MKPVHNDPKANIRELLKSQDVELLFMQMLSVLSKEQLELYGRTEHLSKDYAVTIIVESNDHFFGEKGTYRLLASKPEIEFSITEKK